MVEVYHRFLGYLQNKLNEPTTRADLWEAVEKQLDRDEFATPYTMLLPGGWGHHECIVHSAKDPATPHLRGNLRDDGFCLVDCADPLPKGSKTPKQAVVLSEEGSDAAVMSAKLQFIIPADAARLWISEFRRDPLPKPFEFLPISVQVDRAIDYAINDVGNIGLCHFIS